MRVARVKVLKVVEKNECARTKEIRMYKCGRGRVLKGRVIKLWLSELNERIGVCCERTNIESDECLYSC